MVEEAAEAKVEGEGEGMAEEQAGGAQEGEGGEM